MSSGRYRTSWTKIVIVNLIVLFFLVLSAELLLRVAKTVRSCLSSRCELSRIASVKVRENPYAGLIRFDSELGYALQEGFDKTINAPSRGWPEVKVTITADGFRLSNPNFERKPSDILVVGDSFTFGDQVSNRDTWAACIERKLNRRVDNGGVGGYGAAQALKRAVLQLKKRSYSTLIFSILVGWDFERDRLSYTGGISKPAVIQDANGLGWSEFSNEMKYFGRVRDVLDPAYERSLLLSTIIDGLFVERTVVHPLAANKNDIIRWTLTEFAKIGVKKKILLLQYGEGAAERPRERLEREMILSIARSLGVTVVDTFDVVNKYDPSKIWNLHHTPYGNQVVCDYLAQTAFE
jgi:hypothetical protein